MGRVGTSLAIEAVAEDHVAPKKLLVAITRSQKKWLSKWQWRPPLYDSAVDYLLSRVSESLDQGLFVATDDELTWTFRDHAGMSNGSACAALHWWELSLSKRRESYDTIAASRGWAITSPRTSPYAIKYRAPYPVVAVDKNTALCVPPYELGELAWSSGPFYDGGTVVPAIGDMRRTRRGFVERAALSGRCYCNVCATTMNLPAPTSPIGDLRKAWTRIGASEELQDLATQVVDDAWLTWRPPAVRPALQTFIDALGLRTITPMDTCGIAHRVVAARKDRGE